MAPARRKQQQEQQQQLQLAAATMNSEQLNHLLERLAAAPDLFKEKYHRVEELYLQPRPRSQLTLLLCAAALTTGLQHFQPYWDIDCKMDLPKNSIRCISSLIRTYYVCCLYMLSISEVDKVEQEELLAATGG
jgi:hypothetical protein